MKENKAPAFLFYAGDFLSSPDVQAMDTREVGAYCLLLLNAWQGDLPGHLPNNEDRLRRLCRLTVAEWEVSRDLLLSKFPVADMGHTRYNPRMVAEAEKQAENRRKQAENGKRGGRPKKPNESQKNPPLSVENPTLSKPKANANPNESFSISISTSTNVDEEREENSSSAPKREQEVQPLKADKPERRLPPPPDDAKLFTADTWLGLTNPATFASICTDLRLPIDLDRETYRAAIQDKMRSLKLEAIATSLRSWVSSYFVNEKKKGPLLSLTLGLPTKPTPKEELPKPGQEQRGQVLAFEGESDDYVNRTRKGNYQRQWPAATIHIITPR